MKKIPMLLSDLMKLKKLYPFPCVFLAVLQCSKAFAFKYGFHEIM
jgi:hypothetical protein